jgi:SAM-dependent methyltransferase
LDISGGVVFNLDSLAIIRAAEIENVIPCFRQGARILEIGAGTGQQALELSRRGFDINAIEIASSGYHEARIFPVSDYDGQHIPFADHSFDFVFSSNVLEHVVDLPGLNREIHRVLRPGGFAVHVLPTHTWRFWTTLTLIPAGFQYIFAGPAAIAAWPSAATKRSKSLWYKLKRFCGRHGEHGNLLSEHWLFHPIRWRRAFRRDSFEIVEEQPVGIFHTGNLLLGTSLTIDRRKRLARILGSSCRVYVLRSVGR